MGTRQVYALPSISPYSTDPWNDALKELASVTGLSTATIAPNATLIYWTDPCQKLGVGTGLWEYLVRFNYESETGVERDLFVIGSQGNASLSVGGPVAAPAPNFAVTPFAAANVFQKSSPLTPKGIIARSVGSAGSSKNTSGFSYPIIRPESPTLLQDIYNAVFRDEGGTPQSWTYYYDQQTAVEAVNGVLTSVGTGNWLAKGTGWMAYGQANVFTIAQCGACALQSSGGAAAVAPPSSWVYSGVTFIKESGLILL